MVRLPGQPRAGKHRADPQLRRPHWSVSTRYYENNEFQLQPEAEAPQSAKYEHALPF